MFLALLACPAFSSALPASTLHQHQRRAGPAPGVSLATCTIPNAFALTFDDGPGPYADVLLDQLDKLGVKTTFFVNGNNVGSLDDPVYAARLKRAYDSGHQIASHTYSHADLTAIGSDQIRSEMTLLDDQLRRLIGVKPTYMRPPYGAVNDQVLNVMRQLNYRVVLWNLDTNDCRRSPSDVKPALATIQNALANAAVGSSWIALAHVTAYATAYNLVVDAVNDIRAKGYRLVRIDECFGDVGGAYTQ
ncbi:polysaccharide deacetylase [Thamnocephalis sphaerospora]|uniref:Polysaccharide deacetylase n=1 Tax=Thamnocephalis sphaerospora TaxID=78915 RepID=A0A4P9XXR7_9FUNG|nr:polysaccharide deacetylase [Thamnocephalis sphaerospora]|eukprot:RKP11195.1 polysaccharide deacetylase [Thamnocephalis sphaerospora]